MRRSGRAVCAAIHAATGSAGGPQASPAGPLGPAVVAAAKRAPAGEAARPKRPKIEKKPPGSAGPKTATSSRQYEANWWGQGSVRVAGVDEAGRGPLAGPVVAAACVMPESVLIAGIGDSKQIGEDEREALYELLTNHPEVEWAACVVGRETIDEINILQATMRAMEGAVAKLPNGCDRVLVDGPKVPSGLKDKGEPLVKGDSKSYIIGAASIIAKVTRDRIMRAHDAEYPQYGFLKHKGYGTAEHMALVRKHGPCPIHRRSFQPIKGMVEAGLVPGEEPAAPAAIASGKGRASKSQGSSTQGAAAVAAVKAVAGSSDEGPAAAGGTQRGAAKKKMSSNGEGVAAEGSAKPSAVAEGTAEPAKRPRRSAAAGGTTTTRSGRGDAVTE